MAKRGKKYQEAVKVIDRDAVYEPLQAIELVKKAAAAKFDESVEVAVRLGVDPKKQDQAVRGVVVLPHGTGKTKRVLVFAKGDKAKEAEAAGADYVGDADVINKIQQGWFEFDVCVATPDMMAEVGKLGRILGGKGLMPNPKAGTVTLTLLCSVKRKAAQHSNTHTVDSRCRQGLISYRGVMIHANVAPEPSGEAALRSWPSQSMRRPFSCIKVKDTVD